MVINGFSSRTKANAHRRLKAGAISKVNLTIELAKYMELKPKMHKNMFRFVWFCTAKNKPIGMKRSPIPRS